MSKIKFSHFEDVETKEKTNSVSIYLGNLNMNPWLDDVEVEMSILNGDVVFDILNQQYYTKEELKDIKMELKYINWDNGYEFFDFSDINSNRSYILIGDRNSNTFNMINSPKNLKNINNIIGKI